MDKCFDEYQLPLLKYIDHTTLIQEWKLNLDAAAYGIFNQRHKATTKEERN